MAGLRSSAVGEDAVLRPQAVASKALAVRVSCLKRDSLAKMDTFLHKCSFPKWRRKQET